MVGAATTASPLAQAANNVAYDNCSSNGGSYNVVLNNAAGFTGFTMIYFDKLAPASVTQRPLQTTYVSSLTAYVKNGGC